MKLYDRPPVLPRNERPEWATFIAGRSPDFKTHTGLGRAKNAIHGARHGVLYRWMAEGEGEPKWTPVAIVEPGENKTHPALLPKVVPTEPACFHVIEEQP